MRIRSVIAVPVRVPVKRVGQFARARRTHAERTVLRLEAEDGTIGLGETRGLWAARIIAERFAPAIEGQPLADLRRLRDLCLPRVPDYGYPEQRADLSAFAAIDMAWWDWTGKRTGRPVCALLGGVCRERVSFVAYEYTVDPSECGSEAEVPARMADKAEAAIRETGATTFEFKIGVHPVAVDIAAIRAVRERLGPDMDICIDANMAYAPDEARRLIDGVADLGLANFEEPVASLAGMDALARQSGIAVSSHCTDPNALRAYPGIAGAVGDPQAEGGMLGIRDLAASLGMLGRRYWFRSVWEFGISWAAMVHMGVAFALLERPMQALFNHLSDDLILEPDLAMTGGAVVPPERPGLGVTLDEEALERFRVAI